MRVFPILLLLLPLIVLAQQPATPPATPATKIIGTVQNIDAGAHKALVKTDAGATWSVELPDNTIVLRIPPGEKDLKKATRIAVTDINTGDRVMARGSAGSDPTTLTAAALYVMTKSDLAQKQAHDQAEWQRRGISGLVTAVDPTTKEVTVNVRSAGAVRPVVIQLAQGAVVRRYAPDSVKFVDAKPSTVADIAPGDQVRALGDRSEDGTHFKAEELVSGAFRTIAAQVVSTDPAQNTVVVQDLGTKQQLTVRVNQDTLMRRIPEEMARMMAWRLKGGQPGAPGNAAAAPGGPSGQHAPDQAGPPANQWQRAHEGAPGGAPGAAGSWRQGGGGRSGRFDLQQILENAPALAIADLKKGDALIISSSASSDPGQITAINLVAGVEPFLAAAPRTAGGQYNLGNWNLDMGGGGVPGE